MPDVVPFTMPSLGADMDEGTVVEWRVAPGETVHRGDVVAVVETDKSDLDVEVFLDGVVHDLVVPVGVRVPVGTVLATIEPAASQGPRRSATAAPVPVPVPVPVAAPEPVALPVPVPAARRAGEERHRAIVSSPVLRHLADELHVSLDKLTGSGPGGRVTRDDVERAARHRLRLTPRARRTAARRGIDLDGLLHDHPELTAAVITGDVVERLVLDTPVVAVPAVVPSSGQLSSGGVDPMRTAIARQMVRAWQEIPHFQVAQSIDVGVALDALLAHNAERSATERVLPAASFLRAAARAAADVPQVNGWWRDGAVVVAEGVHLGVVVALRRGGLVAPVIHDAHLQDLDTLMASFRDLVTRARAGRLRASEMTGATLTVTQLGEGEVDTVVPIVHPPQLAILGLGAVQRRPWVRHDAVEVRPVLRATLAVDHRAVDGRTGSAFLLAFARHLEEVPT